MLKLFLWLRYLRRKKIVLLSIAAVALSVALLIVVNSLFSGFIDAVKESYTTQVGDLLLIPPKSIPQYETFLDELQQTDQIEAAAPYLFGGGLLHIETGDVRIVSLQGIDPKRETGFADWKTMLLRQKAVDGEIGFQIPNHPKDNGAWLGVAIAAEPNEKTDEYDLKQLKELIGKQVVLTTLGAENKRKVVKLRISDIAFTETYFGDQTLYLPSKLLQKIQFGSDQVDHLQNIKIKLKEGVDTGLAKEAVRQKWSRFATEDLGWGSTLIARTRLITVADELGQDYFAELRKQMAVLMLIFGVICSIAVLLVFCIFYMIVETRLKDIAIIKSCGASSSAAAMIFAGFGGCVGLAGSALGVILGAIVTNNINTLEGWVRAIFGFKLWRSSSYILNMIPDTVNWSAVGPIVIAAVLGCCLGALIPAIVAARTRPVEILRYE